MALAAGGGFDMATQDAQRSLRAAQILVSVMQCRLDDDPTSLQLLKLLDRSISASRDIMTELGQPVPQDELQPTLQIFDASAVLHEVFDECALFAARKGLKFRIFAPAGFWTRSHQLMLRRIVENFVFNAIKFTTSGGVLIGARRRDEALHLEVRDTGAGIAAEHKQKIFEEFHQVDRDRSGYHGLGLGLANVQNIAVRLGHRIDLRSVLGRGSVFTVVVPDTRIPRTKLDATG